MWFEILPSAGIIFAALSIPGIGMYYTHKYVFGNVSYITMLNKEKMLRKCVYSRIGEIFDTNSTGTLI